MIAILGNNEVARRHVNQIADFGGDLIWYKEQPDKINPNVECWIVTCYKAVNDFYQFDGKPVLYRSPTSNGYIYDVQSVFPNVTYSAVFDAKPLETSKIFKVSGVSEQCHYWVRKLTDFFPIDPEWVEIN